MGKKARIFNIVTRTNDDTGKAIINELIIQQVLDKYQTIDKWAYILHDKDTMQIPGATEQACLNIIKDLEKQQKARQRNLETLNDVEMHELRTAQEALKNNQAKFEAERQTVNKPPHYHIVLQCKGPTDVEVIAKWFNIPVQFVDIPKGNGAFKFMDCVKYLTHEDDKQQLLGKHLYIDDEVHANFDFRTEIIKMMERASKYGTMEFSAQLQMQVLNGEITLKDMKTKYAEYYIKNPRKYDDLRARYIESLPVPTSRINYYISGKGGIGKGLMSRALARQLAKMINPNLTTDDEMFFEVGRGKTTFMAYDGQPVIIWDDMRASELLHTLGGRGTVFDIFETHPNNNTQDVKYNKAKLVNYFNIVNSVQGYQEFLDSLAGEYESRRDGAFHKAEDKGQSYRRFPILIPIEADSFKVLLNKGYFEDTDDYETLINYGTVTGNFQKVVQRLGNNTEQKNLIEGKLLEIPVTKTKERLDKEGQTITEEEAQKILEEEFADYGTVTKEPPKIPNTSNYGMKQMDFDDLLHKNWDK